MVRELQPAMKLTVSVGGDERHAHHPLYQEVLRILNSQGIVGATLTRGVMSYGIRRSIHTMLNEIQMENLPIIIEAIGERVNVQSAAVLIAEMLGEHGLVMIQPTMVACWQEPDERREN
jgi:PII-like signaling protein